MTGYFNRGTIHVLDLCVAVAAGFLLSGCTLIGLGVGMSSDNRKPAPRELQRWEWASIKYGTTVSIRTTDGIRIKGEFLWITEAAPEIYSQRYEVARRTDSALMELPLVGDTVTIEGRFGEPITGPLVGFDLGYDDGTARTAIRIAAKDSSMSRSVAIDGLAKAVSRNGPVIEESMLVQLIAAKRLPLLSEIILLSSKGRESVPFDMIDQLSYPSHHGALTGFLIGAGIDAALVLISALTFQMGPVFGGE